jgi:hypothetical protein
MFTFPDGLSYRELSKQNSTLTGMGSLGLASPTPSHLVTASSRKTRLSFCYSRINLAL